MTTPVDPDPTGIIAGAARLTVFMRERANGG